MRPAGHTTRCGTAHTQALQLEAVLREVEERGVRVIGLEEQVGVVGHFYGCCCCCIAVGVVGRARATLLRLLLRG